MQIFCLILLFAQCINYNHTISEFSYLKGEIPNCEINCKMNADEDCLKSWIQQDWNLTNSIKTPMGPVFDQRWEGKTIKVM